jgi:hypothetical protein
MKITHCRVSALWVEAFPDLLAAPNTSRLGNLLDPAAYAQLFNDLLASDADPLVRLPWPPSPNAKYPGRNNYWNDTIVQCLRDHARGDAGKSAFKAVVPFRYRPHLIKLGTPDRSFVEGWYFPGGIGLTVTFWLSGEFDPQQVQTAVGGLLDEPLAATRPDGSQERARLNALAERCLDVLRRDGFGSIAPGLRPSPLRVLTVIKAEEDGDPSQIAANQQAMLEAVIAAAGGPLNLTPQRDIYAWSRGAVVWRPDRFLAKNPNLHTLGCLHRNVVLASLNVASLLRAAAILDAQLGQSTDPVPFRLNPYARAVAGVLGRIYGGDEAYTLPCIQQFIDDRRQQPMVSRLRKVFDFLPLKK